MSIKINQRNKVLASAYLKREDLKAIRGGTKAMRAAGTKYLTQMPAETDEEYAIRLKNSVLNNVTSRTIEILSSRPFKKKAFIQTDNEIFKTLNNDFNGMGDSFTDFGRSAFKEGLFDSQVHFFVDFDAAKKNIMGESIFDSTQKHKVFTLENDNILGARYKEGELVHFRFKDYVSQEDGFEDIDLERVWVFDKIDDKVYYYTQIEQIDEKGKREFVDDIPYSQYGLNYIPLVSFYPQPTKRHFDPDIIFQDMADLNITHWQSYAEQRNILKYARIPILFFKGWTNDASKENQIGSNVGIYSTSENADGKYIEPNGNSIKHGREDILDLEQKMQAQGFELIARKTGIQTATGASIDAESSNSILGSYAVALKEAMTKIIAILADWYSIKTYEAEIFMETNFSIDYNDEKIRTIFNLWTNGGITTNAALKQLKELDVFTDDFDIETSIGIASVNEE